jgi:predicted butyrate kinase (DUF1464 family)
MVGWEVTDMGFDFEVKVKVWTGKTVDGVTRTLPFVVFFFLTSLK